MQFKYFYLKEACRVSGIELEARKSYRLTEANYDEVMDLCRKHAAVVSKRKLEPVESPKELPVYKKAKKVEKVKAPAPDTAFHAEENADEDLEL